MQRMAAKRPGRRTPRSNRPPRGQAPEIRQLHDQLVAAGAPREVLQALEGVRDVGEAIERLVGAGLLPSPEDAFAGVLEGWAPLLRPGCDPLSAELAGAEFLAMFGEVGAEDADLPDVLLGMIDAAEQTSSPEALAMLRVLGTVGPAPVRPAATAAGERLVASGLVDPQWVDELGRPTFKEAFGYCAPLGDQEVLAVVFGYGRKRHAFAVLIDHGLGGGVKDCYVADRPGRIREAYQDSALRAGVDLEEYPPAVVLSIMDRALAAKPCPVEPDQVEDVATYLVLLRERLELLRADPPPARKPTRRTRPTVHRLKITLRGSKPPIWRRVEVPSDITLERLHEIVQAAFGWDGYHMWVFETPAGEYGLPDPELGHLDAARRKLVAVAPRKGSRLRYTYDFGDDWEHEILVEEVADAEPAVAYPRCLAGRRACPPEDCGGIWGYDELLAILADPDHPEHHERREWLGLEDGVDLDPGRFDPGEVNTSLSGHARVILSG
jgi:hypothetical protein